MKKMKQWMLTTLICSTTLFTACTSNVDNAGTKDDGHAKKVLLIVLDGWGIGDKGLGDVIARTATPYMDYLQANYPHTELQASGEYVGQIKNHRPPGGTTPPEATTRKCSLTY